MHRTVFGVLVLALVALPPAGMAGSGDDGPEAASDLPRLDELADRAGRLKAGLNRSRYRLAILAEKILDQKTAAAQAAVVFRNQMGGLLKLSRVVFALDGQPVLLRNDAGGDLAGIDSLAVFDGPVAPGDHVLSVALEFQGRGLPYMGGIRVKLRSSHAFTVNAGQAIRLEVVGYEKGVFKPVTERPAIRYVERISDID
jgi:hypothetical protein